MYALEKFYKNACSLSNSLIIKLDILILQMELGKDTWKQDVDIDSSEAFLDPNMKFYRHISGEKYLGKRYGRLQTKPDSDVMIKVIELEEERPLTKELLAEYTITRDELLKQSDYYINLVNQYPDMRLYIHGCLWPANVEQAISAPQGTILSYNPMFLESNEYDLIPKLEGFIKDVMKRWNNTYYSIADEYYLVAFLGVLFSQLPGKIVSLRCGNIGTNKAHSFFVESYFRSKFDLWDAISVLDQDTIWWLYANLDYIVKNIGKNRTLDILLEKVFEKNSIGIGAYLLSAKNVGMKEHAYDYKEPSFEKPEGVVKVKGLNHSYNVRGSGIIPVETVLQQELDITNQYPEEEDLYIINSTKDVIDRSVTGTNLTKVLEISTLKEFNGFNVDTLKVLIDYWVHFLSKDLYGSFTNKAITTLKHEFTDPNTGAKYNITSKIGMLMVIKLMLYALGKEKTPIKKFVVSTVLDSDADLKRILERTLYPDGLTKKFHTKLIDTYPIINKPLQSVKHVRQSLTKVLDYYKNCWILASNAESAFVAANFRNFLYLASLQKEVLIHEYDHEMTIDELLGEEGCNFRIYGDYNVFESIRSIILLCLGIEVNNEERIEHLLNCYKEIISKLTSYTVQPLGNLDNEKSHYIYYNSINFIRLEEGLVELDKDKITGSANNPDEFYAKFIPYDPNEKVRIYNLIQPPAHGILTVGNDLGVMIMGDKDDIYLRTNAAGSSMIKLPMMDYRDMNYPGIYVRLNTNMLKVTDDLTRIRLENKNIDKDNMLKNAEEYSESAPFTELIDKTVDKPTPEEVFEQYVGLMAQDAITNTEPALVYMIDPKEL